MIPYRRPIYLVERDMNDSRGWRGFSRSSDLNEAMEAVRLVRFGFGRARIIVRFH
jgi:hypothetical protein